MFSVAATHKGHKYTYFEQMDSDGGGTLGIEELGPALEKWIAREGAKVGVIEPNDVRAVANGVMRRGDVGGVGDPELTKVSMPRSVSLTC